MRVSFNVFCGARLPSCHRKTRGLKKTLWSWLEWEKLLFPVQLTEIVRKITDLCWTTRGQGLGLCEDHRLACCDLNEAAGPRSLQTNPCFSGTTTTAPQWNLAAGYMIPSGKNCLGVLGINWCILRVHAFYTFQKMAGTIFLVILAIQYGFQPILNREMIPPEISDKVAVLMGEGCKLLIAVVVLSVSGQWREQLRQWRLGESLRVAFVPATLYALQNVLTQYGYRNLDPLTFNLLNQTKVLWTALFLYLLLGKRQSLQQISALLVLILAALLLVSPAKERHASPNELNYLALTASFAATVTSGVCATLVQSALQGKQRNSSLYNIELGLYGSLPLLGTLLWEEPGSAELLHSPPQHTVAFVQGWGRSLLARIAGAPYSVWVPVVVSGLGGINVGLVSKYCGGIRKTFGLIGGLIVTGFARAWIYQEPMTANLFIALILTCVAIYVHSSYPYIEPVTHKRVD
eukprot:g28752.t1